MLFISTFPDWGLGRLLRRMAWLSPYHPETGILIVEMNPARKGSMDQPGFMTVFSKENSVISDLSYFATTTSRNTFAKELII